MRTIFARPYASELTTAFVRNANPIIVGTGVPDCPQNSKVTQIFAKQGYRKFVREDALPDKLPTRKGRAYNASPIKICKQILVGTLPVKSQQNKKDTRVSVLFVLLVTRTGIEPMLQP